MEKLKILQENLILGAETLYYEGKNTTMKPVREIITDDGKYYLMEVWPDGYTMVVYHIITEDELKKLVR